MIQILHTLKMFFAVSLNKLKIRGEKKSFFISLFIDFDPVTLGYTGYLVTPQD